MSWQRASFSTVQIVETEDPLSPFRVLQENSEAADSQRSRRCAVAVAAAAVLLMASAATAAWRTGSAGPAGAMGAGVAQLSEECGWVMSDDCTQTDPNACHCRAAWRSGDGRQGYGPCGQFGERDPCLQGGEPPATGPSGEAALAAKPGEGASGSGHSRLRSGPPVPLNSEDVDRARSAFQEAVQAEPVDEPAARPQSSPEAGPVDEPEPADPPEGQPVGQPRGSPEAGAARAGTGRKGSFLVLGDWGWDEDTHGNIGSSDCQRAIAAAMLDKMRELGDVKFIINVGDSFYPAGVESRSDPKWDEHWRNRYASELRSVPWYSTYGNHDYQHDPCACGDSPEDCAQFNDNVSDTNWFYFPDFSWYKEHPELGLEVVSLDLNQYMDAWDHDAEPFPADCQYSSCADACVANLRKRTDEAIELFKSRSRASTAKSMLVFSHYPTDYLWPSEDLMSGLKSSEGANGSPRHIEYFGGHRHNVDQDSCASIAPNNHWLVGGGGGWGTDGDQQGFVVGEISEDFTIKTYPVLVDMPCGEGSIQFK